MKFKQQCKKTSLGTSGLLIAVVAANALLGSTAWAARCGDELMGDKGGATAAKPGKLSSATAVEPPKPQMDPVSQLQLIAREASRRSAALGAAKLLAEAAAFDVIETRGGMYPEVSVSAGLNAVNNQVDESAAVRQSQANVSLRVSSPLYDGGRVRRMTEYRQQLANAAKLGVGISEEQVVFEALSAALDRSRYKMQAQVYQQYMRKMTCLVEALESIVSLDKGRSSELVQVRKTQAQTELQRDQALAQSRQSELKLKHLVGDIPSLDDGITLPLARVPDVGEVIRQIDFGNEARQLRAQAEASEKYVEAVKAGQMPQVNWSVSSTQSKLGKSNTSNLQAGVSVSYNLFNGFTDDATRQAAIRRAQASREQLQELLNGKQRRTAEVHDAALSSFDRAKRYVDVLRDSELVRNFTFTQWAQMGKRSLFDVMSSESDHFNLRIAYVNALYDGYQASAQLRSMGQGLTGWLASERK